jgi:hypothetical protein
MPALKARDGEFVFTRLARAVDRLDTGPLEDR